MKILFLKRLGVAIAIALNIWLGAWFMSVERFVPGFASLMSAVVFLVLVLVEY